MKVNERKKLSNSFPTLNKLYNLKFFAVCATKLFSLKDSET